MIEKLRSHLAFIVLGALLVALGFIAYERYENVQKDYASAIEQRDAAREDLRIYKLAAEREKELVQKQGVTGEELKSSVAQAKSEQSRTKKEIDKRIAEIEARFESLPKTDANAKARQMAHSMERLRGAWAIYCIQVPADSVCK